MHFGSLVWTPTLYQTSTGSLILPSLTVSVHNRRKKTAIHLPRLGEQVCVLHKKFNFRNLHV